MAKKVRCPECGLIFALEDYLEKGDIVTCPECDVDYKLLNLSPPEIKAWDYEDDDDEFSGKDYKYSSDEDD